MRYKIEFKEEALEDVKSAYKYYEESAEGLGDDFLNKLEEYIIIIEDNPFLFEAKHKPFREVKIKRFPYLIVYEIEENKVIVYSVFHTKRSPQNKYQKQ